MSVNAEIEYENFDKSGKRKGDEMIQCRKCGCRFDDGYNVCPRCGTFVKGDGMSDYRRNEFDHTPEFPRSDVEADRPYALASYLLGFPGILIAAVGQKSRFVRFHNRQAIKYSVLSAVVNIIGLTLILLITFFAGLGMPNNGYSYFDFDTGFLGKMGMRFVYGLASAADFNGFILGVMVVSWIVLRILCIINAVKVMCGRSEEGLLVRRFRFL